MLIGALGIERARLVALVGAGGKTSLMIALARAWARAGERVLVTTTTKIAREEAACEWPAVGAPDAPAIRDALRRHAAARGSALIAFRGGAADGERLAGFAPETLDRLKTAPELDRIVVEADGSARRPLKAPAAHEPVVPASADAVIAVAGLNGLGRPLTAEHLFRPELWSRVTGVAAGAPITAESVAAAALHPEGLLKGCPAGARGILFLNRADAPERRAAAAEIAARLAAAPASRVCRVAAGRLLPAPALEVLMTRASA